ncbi:hypothetical protein IWW48_005612 [Coemansia sp. RSA 1200]|nr:hypothetical protein IWW48_005612 [Coemansia sp. RSA 1200]
MGMSCAYGVTSDEGSVKVLNHTIDIGCTFWGTLDAYALGVNEKLLSKVLKERRNKVFLCTKFGMTLRLPEPGKEGDSNGIIIGANGKPKYVHKRIKDSLERLGTNHIDLYCIHRIDTTTPIEVTVAAMAELVKEGKVRHINLSECTPEELQSPIAAVQIEYSAWSAHIETDGVLETCREPGVTIVAYSPLGRGFLTGQIRSFYDLSENDWRRASSRFQLENFENNLKLVDAMESMATNHGCKPGQLGLAWLLAQEENMVAIFGTKKIKYLDENFAAGQIKLSKDELKGLRQHIDNANIQSACY